MCLLHISGGLGQKPQNVVITIEGFSRWDDSVPTLKSVGFCSNVPAGPVSARFRRAALVKVC